MLEILFSISLSRQLAAQARAKGRSGAWGWLGVGCWFIGELVGFAIGFALGYDAGAYAVALVGAGLGAAIAYIVVANLEGRGAAADGIAPRPIPDDANAHYDPANVFSPPRGNP